MNTKLLTYFLNKKAYISFSSGTKLFGEDDVAIEGIIVDIDDKFIYIKSPMFNNIVTAFRIDLVDVVQDCEVFKDELIDEFDDDLGNNSNNGNTYN
jgi:hypothetical protein